MENKSKRINNDDNDGIVEAIIDPESLLSNIVQRISYDSKVHGFRQSILDLGLR